MHPYVIRATQYIWLRYALFLLLLPLIDEGTRTSIGNIARDLPGFFLTRFGWMNTCCMLLLILALPLLEMLIFPLLMGFVLSVLKKRKLMIALLLILVAEWGVLAVAGFKNHLLPVKAGVDLLVLGYWFREDIGVSRI